VTLATEEPRSFVPASAEETAAILAEAALAATPVRPVGGATKLDWGRPPQAPAALVSTRSLVGVVEHNAADLTAIVRTGTPLAAAQEEFGRAGQMVALDPPLGAGRGATIGGVVATGDAGPLRHRYGAPRDLLLGVQVALSDGTLARSGGKVIKNVAGYDLAKLLAGSFGTLGIVTEVALRLHAVPRASMTVVGDADDADAMQRAVVALGRLPLELECFDVRWAAGRGAVLARVAGAAADERAAAVKRMAADVGLDARVVDDDSEVWREQSGAQRSSEGAVVRVSGLPTRLAAIARAADRLGASVVGRASVGLVWVALPAAGTGDLVAGIEQLRADLHPLACVVLDAPEEVRAKVDVWDERARSQTELMRRVKQRFDPAGILNPGIYLGGI
jgi:glycolate oxidase FAD binding subunit